MVWKSILFMLVSFILGLYLINVPLDIITIPAGIINIEPWIVFLGGLLVIFGAISYQRIPRV
tara:strand:- start:590 stop:775 length:186 start_codon:yes stop_codon:yes gene_type:complete